jgi:hypothetical protein
MGRPMLFPVMIQLFLALPVYKRRPESLCKKDEDAISTASRLNITSLVAGKRAVSSH